MTWTLWRTITLELLRLIGLAGAVLVGVIAFAASVKPLAEGTLDAGGAMKFMLLAVPPMMAYAVPFAAAFGATLAFHRMGQDNEVVAALAGGVSHKRLLVPALAVGLGLGAMLLVINESLTPRLLRSMERMVTLDVTEMLIKRIERGESADLGSVTIHADDVVRLDPGAESEAIALFRLVGVVAIEKDENGSVVSDSTARRATIGLYPGSAIGEEDVSLVGVARFEDGRHRRPDGSVFDGDLRTRPFRIEDAFRNDPKFLTRGELNSLRTQPERMTFIKSRHDRLARRMATVEAVQRVRDGLSETGQIVLESPGLTLYVFADKASGVDEIVIASRDKQADRPIVIEAHRRGPDGAVIGVDRLTAETVTMRLVDAATGDEAEVSERLGNESLLWDLQLEDVQIRGSREGGAAVTERAERFFRGLSVRGDSLKAYARMGSLELLAEADARIEAEVPGAGSIKSARDYLAERIDQLNREITSKQHERVAMSISAMVMAVAGAVTALRMRHQLPLVVYLWSFLPALVAFILISTGQQKCHGDSELLGLPILWSGVVGLAAYAATGFTGLTRP